MNFDNLKTMSREDLVILAAKTGVPVHHKAKPETIAKAITEAALVQQKPHNTPVEVKADKPKHDNTPDDVEAAIKAIKDKRPDFVSKYNVEENTWHFSYKGAEEAGNLAIPLRLIKQKADNVSLGRRALMGHQDGFERMTSIGKNAYTNIVLS